MLKYDELNGFVSRTDANLKHIIHTVDLEKSFARQRLFATEDGRRLLMEYYDAQLLKSSRKWKYFTDGIKNCETMPELILAHTGSIRHFIDALEGKGDTHDLNTLITQARELSLFEKRPLEDVMRERLQKLGLSEFQVEAYTKLTADVEREGPKKALAAIKAQYGEAATALRAERNAQWQASFDAAGDAAASRAGATGETTSTARKPGAGQVEEAAEGFVARFRKIPTAGKVAAGVAAVLIGVGGWVAYDQTRNKPTQEKPPAAQR